ncbi:hypothetical protein HanRHA438_Chr16g0748641 [Helianthus annuus]|nr:hypothetical protein HanRHA438_Chr16g0748641 [Helianthus annuus]
MLSTPAYTRFTQTFHPFSLSSTLRHHRSHHCTTTIPTAPPPLSSPFDRQPPLSPPANRTVNHHCQPPPAYETTTTVKDRLHTRPPCLRRLSLSTYPTKVQRNPRKRNPNF